MQICPLTNSYGQLTRNLLWRGTGSHY